ncbi:MAG: cupin [Aquificota bacterium]|nr:MAG: cupin [Aquificota bacterium]
MSALLIYDEQGRLHELIKDYERIRERLSEIGVRFERWETKEVSFDANQEEVLSVYKEEVERIIREFDFKSVDVVSLTPEHPKREELRSMFLSEHTHSDFEVRFFVDGCGTFYLHPDDKVYVVYCERGDFISVPAGTKHWFDMGKKPFFKAIRFFSIPEGWVANFTGSDISTRIPDHESIQELVNG